MKILYLSHYALSVFPQHFPSFNYKNEYRTTWTENLVEQIFKYPDVDISIATVSSFLDKDYSFRENGVSYYYLKTTRRARTIKLFLPDIIKLRKIINKVNPDIIHVHGAEDCYALSTLYIKIPVLVSIQAAMEEVVKFYPRHSSMKMLPLLANFALKRHKYIHANSPYIENYYKRLLEGAKIFIIAMPINKCFFDVNNCPDENIITFVGSSLILKGADTLIKIAGIVISEFPNIQVKIIGHGSEDQISYLRNLALEYKVDKAINLIGPLDSCEIAQQLSRTKVLVIPTRCDIYGVSLAEALSAGVPVVSSNIMGVPYVVDDSIDGFLLQSDDIKGFSEKISLLLKDEGLRKRMGQKAKEKAIMRWQPDLVAKSYIKAYEQMKSEKLS